MKEMEQLARNYSQRLRNNKDTWEFDLKKCFNGLAFLLIHKGTVFTTDHMAQVFQVMTSTVYTQMKNIEEMLKKNKKYTFNGGGVHGAYSITDKDPST